MDELRMDKGDVTVEEIDEECDACTVGPPTHIVRLNIRSAGEAHELGRYCKACAKSVAERIRDGLPHALGQEGE